MKKPLILLFTVLLLTSMFLLDSIPTGLPGSAFAGTADTDANIKDPDTPGDSDDVNDEENEEGGEVPVEAAPPSEVSISIPLAALNQYAGAEKLNVVIEMQYDAIYQIWRTGTKPLQFLPENELLLTIPSDDLGAYREQKAAKIVLGVKLNKDGATPVWLEEGTRQYLPSNLSGLNAEGQDRIWIGFIALMTACFLSLLVNVLFIAKHMRKRRTRNGEYLL